MRYNPATKPAAAGVLLTLGSRFAEDSCSELIRALIGSEAAGNPRLMWGLTALSIAIVVWVAWTEPKERRGAALLVTAVIILSAVAVGLSWYPGDDPTYAWIIGAAVLSFYTAVSLAPMMPGIHWKEASRVGTLGILGLAALPITAGLSRVEPPIEIPCDAETVAQQVRDALPDALDDAVAGHYAARSNEIGCPDQPFGPYVHGSMQEFRFAGGTNGSSLLVFDQTGEVSVVPHPYRSFTVTELESNRVLHLLTWRDDDTRLYVFELAEGHCTAVYGNKDVFQIPEAQAAALLRLTKRKGGKMPEVRLGDPTEGSAIRSLVAVFTGPGDKRSEYRLEVDGSGTLVPPEGAEWLPTYPICPNSLDWLKD